MAITKHFYDKNNKADWHSTRDGISGIGNVDLIRFGASTVSSIMGKNKWKPKAKTFWNCLGRYLDNPYTENTANGLLIEPFIKLRYQTYSPNEEDKVSNMIDVKLVNKLDDCDYILTNDNYPHLFCSLDFVRPAGEVRFDTGEVMEYDFAVDAKNIKYNVFQSWNSELPIYYKIQAQVQQMLLGSDYAEMAVLCEEKLIIFPCEKDQALRDQIMWATDDFALQVLKAKKVQQFIEESKSQEDKEMYMEVLDNLEPAIDYTDSQTALLYDMYSDEPDGNIMKGNKASDLWARRYLKCNEVIALADKYKTFSKNQLLNYIKECNGALSDEFKVTRVAKNLKPNFRVTKNK